MRLRVACAEAVVLAIATLGLGCAFNRRLALSPDDPLLRLPPVEPLAIAEPTLTSEDDDDFARSWLAQQIPPPESDELHQPITQRGVASWYRDRKTASGERYNRYADTAAHRSLPFGTWVKVRNLDNRRELVVRITDRGPYVRGRIIDLSESAARKLGVFHPGTAPVEIEVIQ